MRWKPNTGGRRLHTTRYILFPVCVRFFETSAAAVFWSLDTRKRLVFSTQVGFYYSTIRTFPQKIQCRNIDPSFYLQQNDNETLEVFKSDKQPIKAISIQ